MGWRLLGGRGGGGRRTIRVALVPAWIEFDGAAQVAQLRRTVTRKGRKTVEVVYLIISDRDAGPAALAAWVRSHWKAENRLHWVRDVTYQEDKSLVRTGNAPLRNGIAAQHCHQPVTPGRQTSSRRQPPSRPRPAAHATAASDCMNDFAGSLPYKRGVTGSNPVASTTTKEQVKARSGSAPADFKII
jgi:hypothetical protein